MRWVLGFSIAIAMRPNVVVVGLLALSPLPVAPRADGMVQNMRHGLGLDLGGCGDPSTSDPSDEFRDTEIDALALFVVWDGALVGLVVECVHG
jgi:hypothetical protein